MKRQELLNEFRDILKGYIPEDKKALLDSFNEDLKLKEDLNIDSLDVISFIIDVENKFSVAISDENLKKLTNVGSCLDIIEQSLIVL